MARTGRDNPRRKNAILPGMPKAPLIYISDPTPTYTYGSRLTSLIPNAVLIRVQDVCRSPHKESVIILVDHKGDDDTEEKVRRARTLQNIAISKGMNFVSINVIEKGSNYATHQSFGANHLDIVGHEYSAKDIHRWLFTVLAVRETLYLIPKEQLMRVDTKTFSEYAYCPISEASSTPRNKKIQFVALVLDKPQIHDGNRLTWSVADHTGVANFYFQYRDANSQYTWDWVLSLKPGDRKVLPRMPMVEVMERKRVSIIKAPFRATALVVTGTGLAIKAVGKGMCKAGKAISLGPRSEWIPEPDLNAHRWSKSRRPVSDNVRHSRTIEIFNEKGERNWSDNASVASTDIGSTCDDEKDRRDFV